jgi:hypothetical protein
MIASSRHPAAMRSYARAGFDPHPTLSASGTVVRREAIPTGLDVREGEERDLELAAEVDRAVRGAVRGAGHGPDLEHMLSTGSRLLVAERPSGIGYVAEHNGSPAGSAPPRIPRRRGTTSCGPAWRGSRRARRRASTGSRAARTGQGLSRSKPASPPPVPSAREEISAPCDTVRA